MPATVNPNVLRTPVAAGPARERTRLQLLRTILTGLGCAFLAGLGLYQH